MSRLRLDGIVKRYREIVALDGLDLDVAEGEAVTIVGPSGSGKSTILRVVAGLESASSGSVFLGDREVSDVAPGERNVSMVFQNFALFPHLTAGENIGFGLAVRKVDKTIAARRVQEMAEIVGCAALLDRHPYELSGGERQRVAVARALARDPAILLLDEPLSNLDAPLRVQLRAELAALHRSLGTTMVYVTHDQVEALTLGDRVAVIDGGVLQQFATPDEIYWAPVNRFVATFIGSPRIGLIPAALDGGQVRAGPFVFEAPAEMRDHAAGLEVGLRPEHLTLVGEPVTPDSERAAVGPAVLIAPAVVRLVEATGSDTYVHLDASGAELVVRVAADVRPAVGDRVVVGVNADRWYGFDAETGSTLVHPPVPGTGA